MTDEPNNSIEPRRSQDRFHWKPILLVIAVLAVYALSRRPAAVPDGWGVDFDQAVAEAQSTGQNLLIDFSMQGCAPCAMMAQLVLPEPRVKAALASFVPVHLDVMKDPDVADRFGVVGTPTFAIVSPEGQVLLRVTGYLSVDQFLAFLKEAGAADQTSPTASAAGAVPESRSLRN